MFKASASTVQSAPSQNFFNIQVQSDIEHILNTPDTYIGSIKWMEESVWVAERVDAAIDVAEADTADNVTETGSIAVSASVPSSKCETRIVRKTVKYIPGFFQLFNELLVNCSDHFTRMRGKIIAGVAHSLPVTKIEVTVNPQSGLMTFRNNGNGIDVAQQAETGLWLPELALAHLRSSTNFDKTEEKIVGGKNGYGASLACIWATRFGIETVDHIRGLKYVQVITDNRSVIGVPRITTATKSDIKQPYTEVTFQPDYARFGMTLPLSDDLLAMMHKRVLDIAAVVGGRRSPKWEEGDRVEVNWKKQGTWLPGKIRREIKDGSAFDVDFENGEKETGVHPEHMQSLELDVGGKCGNTPKMTVTFNGIKVQPVGRFDQYVDLYVGDKSMTQRVYECSGKRWEFAVAPSPDGELTVVSMVNGIYTSKGGKHVEYVLKKIVDGVTEWIEKRKKIKPAPAVVRSQLMLFLRCDVVNPSFGGQTKDCLETPVSEMGSKCNVSDKFIEKVVKLSGFLETVCAMDDAQQARNTAKALGLKGGNVNSGRKKYLNIRKLMDANWAAGPVDKVQKTYLVLTEGDSAKTAFVSGMSKEDQNVYGIYTLKGKVLNVRGQPEATIRANQEIAEICMALGLTSFNRHFASLPEVWEALRYGHVLILTDQDKDGSHIKGLVINLFAVLCPSLLALDGFLCFMNTPIQKASLRGQTVAFYNDGEFETWKAAQANWDQWKIKYYKGLGTSTKVEFMEYLQNPKIVQFYPTATASDCIDRMFNKKRANDRKEALTTYNANTYLNTSVNRVSFDDFIDKEFIHFSVYDCERSIPSVVDGLKPSQRKILYAAFKRGLTSEIKVAQFSGYVSEVSGYHHGEQSLNNAIVGLAQNFVGSNNINLLCPNGQFGTRLMGGKDAAAPRYIFTCLEAVTRALFPAADDAVLTYLEEDGQSIEPMYYVPVIPFLLVNGSVGIGTGYSSNVPCYSPAKIADYLEQRLRGNTAERPVFDEMPYYEGFKGVIEPSAANKYVVRGQWEADWEKNTLAIRELPIGYWSQDLKELLDELCEGTTTSKGEKIPPIIKTYIYNCRDFTVDVTMSFLSGCMPATEAAIEKVFKLSTSLSLDNMMAYDAQRGLHKYESVKDIVDAHYAVRLDLYAIRRNHLLQKLREDLKWLSNKLRYIRAIAVDRSLSLCNCSDAEIERLLREVHRFDAKGLEGNLRDYDYLLDMKMHSMGQASIQALQAKYAAAEAEMRRVEASTPHSMWLEDLGQFKTAYTAYLETRQQRYQMAPVAAAGTKAKKGAGAKKK